ncbi:MAG: alpha/beta hydrolase [Deltaproteobacteria bacterium]|nr:alpha/beta hydrolase [Deltaproteobacteria bacterium]MBW2533136.1 alpha/beta hydrolase [Deltaproteobacteria bacterium]
MPTLVVVGEEDVATTPAKARHLTAAIPKARLAVIPRAGHLCTVEEPAAVNRVLHDFLEEQTR